MFEKAKLKYKDDSENKILISKIADKYEMAVTRNKITYTDFLDMASKSIALKILQEEKIQNYIFFGGRENADREILIFFPEKFSKLMVEKNYNKILNIISINLPHELSYEHREYLSGIMKLGMKREKFGDIIVRENGADIVCFVEVSEYLKTGLLDLTRFKKSNIKIVDLENLKNVETKFQELKFIVSSLRLDNFVAEVAKCSRTNAEELIDSGKVFINSVIEYKYSKQIKENDIITVRGKGKYIFINIEKETRSGRFLLNMKKFS